MELSLTLNFRDDAPVEQVFRAATEVTCRTLCMQGHLYVNEQREFSINEDLDTVLLNRSA